MNITWIVLVTYNNRRQTNDWFTFTEETDARTHYDYAKTHALRTRIFEVKEAS